jgi:hypothetical protein
VVIVGGQTSEVSGVTTSYRAPTILTINQEARDSPGLSTAGNEVVTITGENFGPSHSIGTIGFAGTILASYSNYNATGCVVSVNYTQIHCLSAVGVGSNHSWNLSVGGLFATPSPDKRLFTSNYASAVLLRVTGEGNVNSAALQTAGSERIKLSGTNFGTPGTTIFVWYENPTLTGMLGVPIFLAVARYLLLVTQQSSASHRYKFLDIQAHQINVTLYCV